LLYNLFIALILICGQHMHTELARPSYLATFLVGH